MTDELYLTAVHEAAHTVMAIFMGVRVREVSIKPTPARGAMPASLGHMRHRIHPDPRPQDLWHGSYWVETWCMVALAGGCMERLVAPDEVPLGAKHDYMTVLDLLRTFPRLRRPLDAWQAVRALGERTTEVLKTPRASHDVQRLADLLMTDQVLPGAGASGVYARLYNGECAAQHPRLERRCALGPHPFGDHMFLEQCGPSVLDLEWVNFEGLPRPTKQAVGAMPSMQKTLRAINRGQPPRPLTPAWKDVLLALLSGCHPTRLDQVHP